MGSESWTKFAETYSVGDKVVGKINRKTEFGIFVALLGDLQGLVHISKVSWGSVDYDTYFNFKVGDEISAIILRIDPEGERIGLSIRDLQDNPRLSLDARYPNGHRLHATVTSMSDHAVFVSIEDGVNGVVRGSEISWSKQWITASDCGINVGDTIEGMVLGIDSEQNHPRLISLSIKHCLENPWLSAEARYIPGQRSQAVVTGIVDYGVFCAIEDRLEGLVHVNDISWAKRRGHPSTFGIKVGDIMEVMILDVDQNNLRMPLSIKHCLDNPWVSLDTRYAPNQRLQVTVTNFADYGVFCAIEDGLEGLVHFTEMSWKRKLDHPSDYGISIGDNLEVMILDVDPKHHRISLSIKRVESVDPWLSFAEAYSVGQRSKATVTKIVDYGIFCAIEDGLEGLVHLTEMSWKRKPSHPSQYGFSVGDNVEVMILDIDQKLQRLALSIKQCVKNPWVEFIENYRVGDEVVRSIVSIVDYGFFVRLDEGVDGLVHTNEISAVVKGKAKLSDYKKGDEVNVVILGINVEEEQISLGIK